MVGARPFALVVIGLLLLGGARPSYGRRSRPSSEPERQLPTVSATPGFTPMTGAELERYEAALRASFKPEVRRFLKMEIPGPRLAVSRKAEERAFNRKFQKIGWAVHDIERRYPATDVASTLALAATYEHLRDALERAHEPAHHSDDLIVDYAWPPEGPTVRLNELSGQLWLRVVTDARAASPERWADADEVRYAISRLQALAVRDGDCGLLDFDLWASQVCEATVGPAWAGEQARRRATEDAHAAALQGLADRVARLDATMTPLRGCSAAVQDGMIEVGDMVLEQARRVLDERDADMVRDLQIFVDEAQVQADAMVARCATP